jgi:hypothetical protein
LRAGWLDWLIQKTEHQNVHVHPQTARALNERAKKAVPSLTRWAKYLRSEIIAQSPPLEQRAGVSKYAETWPETITLTLRRNDLEYPIDALRTHAKELGDFTS